MTVHRLDAPFTDYPGYHALHKQIAAHPILTDLAMGVRLVPNPWRKTLPNARPVTLEAGKNLSFEPRLLRVRAGERIKLTFSNPDVVPHNWMLVKPGSLERVGDLTNKLVADPEAVARHYVPRSDDVLYYTDIVPPHESFTIYFRAPIAKGSLPVPLFLPGTLDGDERADDRGIRGRSFISSTFSGGSQNRAVLRTAAKPEVVLEHVLGQPGTTR